MKGSVFLIAVAFYDTELGRALRVNRVEPSKECPLHAKKHNVTWRMIPSSVKQYVQVDPTKELMWTCIPKVACTSVRAIMGTWCASKRPACGEIRFDIDSRSMANDMFNNKTRWGVWFRDPVMRAQPAYHDLDSNRYIQRFMKKHTGCKSSVNCTFRQFVQAMYDMWSSNILYSNEHFALQTSIAKPHKVPYDFIGYLGDKDDAKCFWAMVNSTPIYANNHSIISGDDTYDHESAQLITEMYAQDYRYLQRVFARTFTKRREERSDALMGGWESSLADW